MACVHRERRCSSPACLCACSACEASRAAAVELGATDDEIRGWKAIGRELGVDARVAQRYVELGLPVAWFDPWRGTARARRRRRGWSGVVVASVAKLRAWKRSRIYAHRVAA